MRTLEGREEISKATYLTSRFCLPVSAESRGTTRGIVVSAKTDCLSPQESQDLRRVKYS